MYIRRIEINNIRSIEHFEMTFPEGKEAGWHVLIGDNGSGKSTIVRAVALGLLDYPDIMAARQAWNEWLKQGTLIGNIELRVIADLRHEFVDEHGEITNKIILDRPKGESKLAELSRVVFHNKVTFDKYTPHYIAGSVESESESMYGFYAPSTWFSTAYGPYRRFSGGDRQTEEIIDRTNPKLAAHITVFGEDFALSESLAYLKDLYVSSLFRDEDGHIAHLELEGITKFINSSKLLPHNLKVGQITRDGVSVLDDFSNIIPVQQLSEGYRTVLSLTLDLMRQLFKTYGLGQVLEDIDSVSKINLPGVVLIDEVDSHLHPTWQDTIGEWFTTHFPNIQFIVTTHSPIICRAAEKGSIWRLAAPGSGEESGEVIGTDRDRLIYGNILEALGTDAFGEGIERSDESQRKLARLTRLNQLYRYGKISEAEKIERDQLSKIFSTDDSFAE